VSPLVRSSARLTGRAALDLIHAAENAAAALKLPVSIAVVTETGQDLATYSMDGSSPQSTQVARDKAYTAVAFGMPSDQFHDRAEHFGIDGPAMVTAAVARIMPLGGGVPVTIDGVVAGAVGVSGGTGDQDKAIAISAIETVLQASENASSGAGDFRNMRARRVITGAGSDGRSTIISDENTPTQKTAPGFNISDIWTVTALPANVADEAPTGDVELTPTEGIVLRVVTFPPDDEWNPEADYKASLEAFNGGDSVLEDHDSGVGGLHITDTIDAGTVITGELTLLLESGETTLYPGDSFIQRGVKHSWRNRTGTPVTILVAMIAAER